MSQVTVPSPLPRAPFASEDLPEELVADIQGNASPEAKAIAFQWAQFLLPNGGFDKQAMSGGSVTVKELWVTAHDDSVNDRAKVGGGVDVETYIRTGRVHELGQVEVKMVSEVDVVGTMCDADGNLAQGCMAYLIDEGSAVALLVHNVLEGAPNVISVSQNMNLLFHSTVPVGSTIRLVSRSVTARGVLDTCRCDIWDKENNKLILTGIQTQTSRSKM